MKWESINTIITAGAGVATIFSTLIALFSTTIAFGQWRDAKKTKKENQSLKILNERLEIQSLNHQILSTTVQGLAKELKEFKTKLPDEQFLNKQINSFEKGVEKFQENFKIYKEAASWLFSNIERKHLAKKLGDEVIKNCDLKLSKDKRYQFYKDIYKYLTLLYYTLNSGVPMPKELITNSLHKKQYYETALNYLLKLIPKDLSDEAVKLLEEHLTHLIRNLG